jgi:SAM-dependent methyltransferase
METSIYTNGSYLCKNPTWDKEDSEWKAKNIAKMLDKHKIEFRSYVEIGCGAGKIIHHLSKKYLNSSFHGYDISPQAIEMAKEYENNRVRFFNKSIITEANLDYDVAAIIDVIEHVPDYMSFLEAIRNVASRFVFLIPLDITVSSVIRNLLISARNSVGHLHYFMKDTAIATLEETGYNVIDYFYTPAGLEHLTKVRHRLAWLPRRILYSMNQDLCVRTLGGFPLLILAEPTRSCRTQ